MRIDKLFFCAAAVLLLLLLPAPLLAQTGKIAGTVTDAATGNPLPGVNVVIVGTQMGATTNAQGNYAILNVPPGNHDVRASFVGYAPVTQQGVNVNIDLTAEVNFEMQEQTAQLEEVTIQATEPVVKRDVSANVANLSSEDIENIPVASVEEVVNLQAGIEPGLSVRGSGANEVAMLVDGMSMRSGRTNAPFTGISYTSIAEVQVQTGGFNAEYGNVRSGLINVVTKEGPRDHYTADVLFRYTPASRDYFGPYPDNESAYWMRPYLDPDVAFVGTEEGPWDQYTQDQYPEFKGWNAVAEELANDENPDNNLTPEQAQQVFEFRHRKSFEINDPDYVVDGSFGGPVPGISSYLGDLRFFGSYRQTQSAFIVPQMRDTYRDRTGRLKLTSDVASNMKLMVQGLYSKQMGINVDDAGGPGMYQGDLPPYPWSTGNYLIADMDRDGLFANHTEVLRDVSRLMIGGDFTHTLGSNTFYEVRLQRSSTDYSAYPGRLRSHETVETIGGMQLDEAPFGWEPEPAHDLSGLRLGGHWGGARDSSGVAVWNGSVDLTSQLNQFLQVKTGLEYIYSLYDINHRQTGFFTSIAYPTYLWSRTPRQGAAYAQSKLEFQGMIANVGLRLDYFYPGGEWYQYDPYSRAFSSKFGFEEIDEVLEQTPTDRQFALSPRLGVSFPITENSKLYVNYGHFRQMLNPQDIFVVRGITTGAINMIGNPNHPMPRTIAYELGYEQNMFDMFLLRLTGYYKAFDDQSRSVRFTSLDGEVDYYKSLPNNYQDVRGAEISLRKNAGRWVRGFANFTYMAEKNGNFGFARYFQNRAEQRRFERESRAHYQTKPVPQPFARGSIEFLVPPGFGPETFGLNPLGDWRVSLLGTWRAGQAFTWTGGGGTITGLENNVRWADYYNFDLRLTKNLDTGVGQAQFFADVTNVFNIRHLNENYGFEGSKDFQNYMNSLHLPEDAFSEVEQGAPYDYISGDDEPGDFRTPGAPFVPIEMISADEQISSPSRRALYYREGAYYSWDGDELVEAREEYVDAVLENKQYIDMPNESYFRYLNPRHVTFGVRVSL